MSNMKVHNFEKIVRSVKRKWRHLCLQPIHIFVFHQVSEQFDESTMCACDWTEINQFKERVIELQKEYEFISLEEATNHLKTDIVRKTKYAVLTSDDGWESILSVLPWLYERNIPITLFVNPAYLLKLQTRENGMNRLLSEKQLRSLLVQFSNITIASHGWNHDLCTNQSMGDFNINTKRSHEFLKSFDKYISYFAFPCGNHTIEHDNVLANFGIIPVYCDGMKNYTFEKGIHRECIDGNKKNMSIRLSYILLVYNVERFLSQCLDSIFSQGLREDEFEVICVNDCSRDESNQILKQYQSLHSNMHILSFSHNRGPSAARNEGVKNAKGKYIWVVDSDDVIGKKAIHLGGVTQYLFGITSNAAEKIQQ